MIVLRRQLACGALMLALPAALASQAPTLPPRPTMADVVSYALRFSPDVVTARLQIDSAGAEQRIARAWPNPTFAVVPGTPFQYTVNQPIDIGPNRIYRTRAAARGAEASRRDAETAKRQVVFAVRQAFLDLQLAEAVRDVAFEQDTIMYRLLRSDSLRYAEGDMALRDLTSTELQYAHAQSALARAEAAARTARISLQLAIGVPHPDTAFRTSGALAYRELSIPVDSLRAIAANRSDILAARERVAQGNALKSLAGSLAVPVPGLAAVYQQQPFASGSNYALGLSLSLPVLYWFSGERGKAEAGLQAAKVAERRVAAAAEGDLVAALANLRAARALAVRYASGLLERARATVEMQRFAYERGNASLLDVLTAISAFGDTQTDYYTSLHDYWVAAYAIDRAVGEDIIQ